MPKPFALTSEYPQSVERVHAVLTDPAYWQGRFGEDPASTLEVATPDGPGTIAVDVASEADPSGMPAVVGKMMRGPLVIRRSERWSALGADGVAHDTIGGSTSGMPVEIAGAAVLRPDGSGGSVIEIEGRVTVDVKIVGGQLEGIVAKFATDLMAFDRDYLTGYLKSTD